MQPRGHPPELQDPAMPSPAKCFPQGASSSLLSQILKGAGLVVEPRSHVAVLAAKDAGTEFGGYFGDTGSNDNIFPKDNVIQKELDSLRNDKYLPQLSSSFFFLSF